VDGTVKATGSATTNGQLCNMTVSLERFYHSNTNPANYGTTNNSCVLQVKSGRTYNLLNDFGAASPALIDKVAERLARNREAGLSETSEAVRGGALHLMALSYCNQFSKQSKLLSSLSQVSTTLHYLIGLVAQEDGYYIDGASQREFVQGPGLFPKLDHAPQRAGARHARTDADDEPGGGFHREAAGAQ
jgi:hypothetical protein